MKIVFLSIFLLLSNTHALIHTHDHGHIDNDCKILIYYNNANSDNILIFIPEFFNEYENEKEPAAEDQILYPDRPFQQSVYPNAPPSSD